jgi:hypothetical protein
MTHDDALAFAGTLGLAGTLDVRECTGDVTTCAVDECVVCSIRECPWHEPLHFHHDGCPACETA